jgi:hypothetical protein
VSHVDEFMYPLCVLIDTVIKLANDLVKRTEFQGKVATAKRLRKLDAARYHGFLHCHSFLLTTSGTVIKDVKHRSWVTKENVENMYENVYKTKVEAGITKDVEEAIQLDAGLPTRYVLTNPEHMLFIDEICFNRHQLKNGKVGGELLIVPKVTSECGAPMGATTDLHYTVPALISDTGEAVLCALIFKSDLAMNKIPISWKTGIGITADIEDEAVVMHHGGTTCFF